MAFQFPPLSPNSQKKQKCSLSETTSTENRAHTFTAFAEALSTMRQSREARRSRASLLVVNMSESNTLVRSKYSPRKIASQALSSKESRSWTSYSRGCEPKGKIYSGDRPWEWIALPPPSPHFAQENITSRIVYSNGYGPWEREGVQRQLIASTTNINKKVLWFSAVLTNIMQTRDATHKSLLIHPACTPTKLTYYANSKYSNKKKKWQCFRKHTSPHLTHAYSYALLVSFLSKGAWQIPGCS